MKMPFMNIRKMFLLTLVGFSVLWASQTASAQCTNTLTSASLSSLQNDLVTGCPTILLHFNGVLQPTAPLEIVEDTIIDATGFNVAIGGGGSQIFTVDPGVNFTLINVILSSATNTGSSGANGAAGGNGGTTGGSGASGVVGSNVLGGAVFNQGNSTFINCTFTANAAVGGAGGIGGNGGNGTSTGGNGGNGGGGGIAYGGAIYNLWTVLLTNCTVSGNISRGGSGGTGGTNGATAFVCYPGAGGAGGGGYGAGIYNLGIAKIFDSTFSADASVGGATSQWGGGVATGQGDGAMGPAGAPGDGGAIYNAGTNILVNCTFYANTGTGSNGGKGGNYRTNSLGSGGNGGSGGEAKGGGIYNAGFIAITNCTFANGTLVAGSGGVAGSGAFAGSAGGSGSVAGANIYNASGTFDLKNSILAYPSNTFNASGTIVDQGNNLSSDTTPSFGTNSHNSRDPMLAPLANYGGPTLTMALSNSSPAIGVGDNSAAPLQDQRGYWWTGTSSIGAYEYGAIAAPIISIFALGPTASEDGDVGLFFVERTIAGPSGPLTVNLTISGTATNGVNCALVSNSITFSSGIYGERILVRALPGTFAGTNLSISLTIATNANYIVNTQFGSDTVILQPISTFNPVKRYVRGTSTASDFQSFVMPLDSQIGIPLSASGGNATTLFPSNLWTTNLYHYDGTNLATQTSTNGRIGFQNPIVAFGAPVGGSPLYVNHTYRFGVSAGYYTSSNLTTALRIKVYNRSNSALAGTINLPIPDVTSSNQLLNFATNGFALTTNGFGLTVVYSTDYEVRWNSVFGQNFLLSHTASTTATNYYYVVEEQGLNPCNDFSVRNSGGDPDWSKLYAMEFSVFPDHISTFIDQPHFDGAPLPSAYQGMSLQELTNVSPTLPSLSSLNPSNYLTIDASPELRRHPTLDQFVADMGSDPIALANYVINEIDLADAIDYDTNYNSQPAVNLGGVNRGALATFQEGQGSPTEQCALLVYLLRQAGVPAAYVYPTNNGLKMLDFQLSKLLRVQLNGAQSFTSQTNLPQLIAVNYPWVAAYIGTNWVQIFPWLKDTEVTEGFNFYDYMPSGYNSGFKWLTHFLTNDPSIFSLSTSDQPRDLLPLFIQTNLDLNYPGMSVDDLGVQIVNRRHEYAQWSDFPKPFALSGAPSIMESLSTNLNLFNTLEIFVYSQNNPSKFIDTTEMRVMDFHDRKLLLKFVRVGTSNLHNMVLTLSPYSTNITQSGTFSTNVDSTWKLSKTTQLNTNDDNIIFQVTHRRNKFLPSGYVAPGTDRFSNVWNYVYAEGGQQQAGTLYQFQDTFRKGDLLAFCLDTGRITKKMLNVQAEEIWQANQALNGTNAPAPDLDIYGGTTAYLMGMSYFNNADSFTDFINGLHKVQPITSYAYGFGLIRPQRDGSGQLVSNGVVNPLTPCLHMPNNGVGLIFNGTLHPDSGIDGPTAYYDWFIQRGLELSAAEHGVLQGFYQTNAISTVKLLQQATTNTVILTADNYTNLATNLYHGVQLQNADPSLWSAIANFFALPDPEEFAFLTPGIVTNGNFSGVGGLLVSHFYFLAQVSGLNGGIANNVPGFTDQNAGNITVKTAPDGSTSLFIFQGTSPLNNLGSPVDGAPTASFLPNIYNGLLNGQEFLDPALLQTGSPLQQLYGTQNNQAGIFSQLYNPSALTTTMSAYNDSSERVLDPVNVMTGEFYIDAVDLTLPGPMNLQVRRNYGSQNMAENEFGFGWKLNYVPYLSLNTNATLIYAAESDGTVVAYRQTATNSSIFLPTTADNPMLNNNSSFGIGSVANLFNNRILLSTPGGTNSYVLSGADGSVRTFTTRPYAIGTFSRLRPYLDTWLDNKGNSYAFQYGANAAQTDYGKLRRVQSSNGNFFGFYYDIYGHIIEAYTGDGRRLQYEYDEYGDLITVTLPDESQINYKYQHLNQITNSVTNAYSTHLILQELKPEGRLLQNAYDSQRRVTNQFSTVGSDLIPIRTGSFVYSNNYSLNSPTNQLTGTTWLYDYTNHISIYKYSNSLIQQITDPLNQSITQTWYGAATNGGYPRSLKSVTDKRGLSTVFQYDASGNVINAATTGDLVGNGTSNDVAVSSANFNTNNLPLLIIDAIGNQTQFIYSSAYPFLPQEIIKFAGTNAVSTNFLVYTNSSTIVVNGTNTTTNSSFGLLARNTRAYNSIDAATNDLFYDGRGFVTNSISYSGNSDPSVVNNFIYNERGELVLRTDAAGRSFSFAYDPIGRLAAKETFDIGQNIPMDWIAYYYNENGEMNWIDGPRYNPEDYVFFDYDGAGRKIQEIHWKSEGNRDGTGVSAATGYGLYPTSFYQYDPLGDLLRKTDPLGNYVVQTYDAIGQLTSQTFYGSNGVALATNMEAHELGGLVSYATNSLGGVTSYLYNSRGQIESQSNPDGSTNGWRYDLSGRLITNYVDNGNFWKTIYDDTNRRVTNVLFRGTNALATNSTQFDVRGNTIKKIDALANVYTAVFDGLDRVKVSAGPATTNIATSGMSLTNLVTNIVQEITTHLYDASGRVLTVSNALGEKTVTTNDALGRPIYVAVFASNSVTPLRLTTTSYSADHNNVTVTSGTGAGAIVTTAYSDSDGRPVLNVAYPTNGTIEYTWSQYDAAGNCIAKQRLSNTGGTITTWATNGWTYDGLNRVRTDTSKDGAVTTYDYDALNNVTNRAMPGGLNWNASYSNDGRIATENEFGGSLTARSVNYQYYPAGNQFAGLLQLVTDGRGTTKSNDYDSFLRLATVATDGTSLQQKTTTTYSYDLNNHIIELDQAFGTNTTGQSTTVKRTYDAAGRLGSESVTSPGTHGLFSGVQQTWDAAGRRVGMHGIGTSFFSINVPFGYQADGSMITAGEGTFGYADNGLLITRTNSATVYTVNQRDGSGRILQTTITAGILTPLTENLTWRNDGRLNAYAGHRSDFTDTRNYSYTTLTERLASESFNITNNQWLTNTYAVDNGGSSGLGILTAQVAAKGSSTSWTVPSVNGVDGLGRVTQSQDTLISRSSYGTAAGAATVSATLDGSPVSIQFNPSLTNNPQWRADLDLSPGSHTLSVSAYDSTGGYSGTSNSTFTVASTAADTNSNAYDGNGNITQRTWVNTLGVTNRTQILVWDAFDRLVAVTNRDALANGFNWAALYDGLGRRLQTTYTIVTNNEPIDSSSTLQTVQSVYDPEREFLEIGVILNDGTSYQKTYGPDANGTYGGKQGVGGLVSVLQNNHFTSVPVIQDYFGNVLAYVNGNTVTWNSTRFGGYGPAAGYQSPAFSLNISLVQSLGWRGKRVDETGLIYLGARQYDPASGRFISADPLGHSASMDLYSYCGGDPVNRFDPDGRLGKAFYQDMMNGGAGGQALRDFGSYLENYNASSAGGGYFLGFTGTLVNELAAISTPNTYVNGATRFGNNINTIYNDTGLFTAGSYALTSWNVGAIWSGVNNIDQVTGQPVGDWYQRGGTISGGVAGTAGIAAGGLSIYNWATTVPVNVPPVINPADAPPVNLKYHYTSAPESSFQKGLWEQTSVTDTPNLTAQEAVERLGVKTPPDKVIPVIDNGNFIPNKPAIVEPHPLGPGGGADFINRQPVPPSQILPARPVNPGG